MTRNISNRYSCTRFFHIVFNAALLAIIIPAFFTLKIADADNASSERGIKAKVENLHWIDKETGKKLFDINDIVRYDWDKQIFELSRNSAMDFMVQLKSVGVGGRRFIVKDNQGSIYEGSLVTSLSSIGYAGPAIFFPVSEKISPPLFKISGGYPVDVEAGKVRFSQRVKDNLQKSNLLGEIDVNNPPLPIIADSYGWFGEKDKLRVWIDLFPETFKTGGTFRMHIWLINPKNLNKNNVVDVRAEIVSGDGKIKLSKQEFFPIEESSQSKSVVFEMDPYDSEKIFNRIVKPVTSKLNIEVSIRTILSKDDKVYSEPVDQVKTDTFKITILSEKYNEQINEIKVQKQDLNWTLHVVTSDNPDPNQAYLSRWFLKKANQKEELIALNVSAMSHVNNIKASENGRYLAVVSSGEGAYILEVIDLLLLLEQKKYKVLQTIDPFPGGIEIDKWDGDKLIVNSGALLTHRNKNGRVLSPSLGMMEMQKYALTIKDGHIEPLSEYAKNPIAYFIGELSANYEGQRANAASALTVLNDKSAVPALQKALAVETNEAVKKDLRQSIDRLVYRIVPGERVGDITKDADESGLRKIFGAQNVEDANIPIGEGKYEPGTVIYPKDETRKLEIIWRDTINKSKPKEIRITGSESKWYISDGISLGTKLKDLEKINGRSFILTGLTGSNLNISDIVIYWNKGHLENLLENLQEKENPNVLIKLKPKDVDIDLRQIEKYAIIIGGSPFLSTHPVVQKLNPYISQLVVNFSEDTHQAVSRPQIIESDKDVNLSWGQESKGLMCAAVPAKNEIEQGMNLDVTIKLRCNPEHLEKGIKQLNSHSYNEFAALLLTNMTTKKTVSVYPYDPSNGMPYFDDGVNVIWLDSSTYETLKAGFPLVTERDALEPGLYECRVEYSFPNEPSRWWSTELNGDWNDYGFWNGTITSAPLQLKINREIPKTRKALLPKQLHYDKKNRTVYYTEKEAVEVNLPARNGYFTASYLYYGNPHEKDSFLRGQNGVPNPAESIDNSVDIPADGKFVFTIQIFETDEPPVHMWSPESGDYKVLWEKTFEFKAGD